jgi:UDP-glucose 4-epimerase
LGFIGSNLTIKLVELGANVTVVDAVVPGCGGNAFNLTNVAGDVRVIQRHIDEVDAFADALERAELVFNLAGEISHIHSMLFPERDLRLNAWAQLAFLQGCVKYARGIRIVYAGTRQVYGVPEYLPVDEKHPVNPTDFNGVHKYASSQYHLMMTRLGQIRASVLRLTNIYGPRMALNVPCQGFLSTYLRRALTGQTLEIFGDGTQLRDPLHVDDLVEVMLRVAEVDEPEPQLYNIGGPETLGLGTIAAIVSDCAGLPAPVFRDFPADRKAIDIGSYEADMGLVRRETGWSPKVKFADGVAQTLEYYREHFDRYLDRGNPNPACALDHGAVVGVSRKAEAAPSGSR